MSRSSSGVLRDCRPASAADVDAELVRLRIQSPLQRAHHRRRDAGGVPVHPHHRAQRLEPERIAQPRQKRGSAVVIAATLSDDRGAERRHPRRPATAARGRRAAEGRRRPIASCGHDTTAIRLLHGVARAGSSSANRLRSSWRRGEDEALGLALARLTRIYGLLQRIHPSRRRGAGGRQSLVASSGHVNADRGCVGVTAWRNPMEVRPTPIA